MKKRAPDAAKEANVEADRGDVYYLEYHMCETKASFGSHQVLDGD